jgi:hypothetical protein
MALADDIRAIRDRALADLNAAHDYYADTKSAWRFVQRIVQAGEVFSIRNTATGNLTTQADLAGKARGYVKTQLAEATFQQFISIFEGYFSDLLCLWLTAYPRSLIAKKVDFEAILDAPDKDAITLLVVNEEVNKILRDRPAGWFAYFEDKAKLGCPAPGDIESIAEAKASRDLLVHNRGVANRTYALKAGKLARYRDGQRIEIPEHYHRDAWELIRKVVTDMSSAAVAKIP